MNTVQRNLDQIWGQLRSQKASRSDFLEQLQIKDFRGINDLRVSLPFPVCVLAGANGCGKSTVLFSLACAYRGPQDLTPLNILTPARIFPSFSPNHADDPHDDLGKPELVFTYTASSQPFFMTWKRGTSKWNASFLGRKGGKQPVRATYLHTLSKLTNPSELRSVIQLAQHKFSSDVIDASNIAFAQRILGFRYAAIKLIKGERRDLLFAERADDLGASGGVHYSEFHMSAGERALIRLSINLSKLENALILIDEVEAGLHPQVQQLLMLELQRLALRNQLQIIVTTHSPTILETVPLEARVFLERTDENVVRREAYRDIIQKALYGRSQNALAFLCEDEESEAFLRGLLDHLGPRIDLVQNDIEVGRDTGKDQLPAHLETLARFRKLDSMVFVLDGDGGEVAQRLAARAGQLGQPIMTLLLPGGEPPEIWAWKLLTRKTEQYASFFGQTADALKSRMNQIDAVYESATDKPINIAKNKIYTLVEESSQTLGGLFRQIGKTEADSKMGDVFDLVNNLEELIRNWRTIST